MGRYMFRLILLILVFLISCSTGTTVKTDDSSIRSMIKDFLIRSEGDVTRAGLVIQKHRIIQHLTHLRKMNNGGKKFYLLEKDNITEMINAVTEGIYNDYILINRHATIVYSKNRDDLFGSEITYGFESSPLSKLYQKGKRKILFHDISPVTAQSNETSLFLSIPVYVQKSFHGILILETDHSTILKNVKGSFTVIDEKGIVRISKNRDEIYSKYKYLKNIDKNEGAFSTPEGKVYYSTFVHNDLKWIICEKK